MLFGVVFRFIVSNQSELRKSNEPIRRPTIFQAYTFADEELKEAYYGSDSRFISEVEKCPPMIVGAQDRFPFVTFLNQSEL